MSFQRKKGTTEPKYKLTLNFKKKFGLRPDINFFRPESKGNVGCFQSRLHK